jgi:hypothetical protein
MALGGNYVGKYACIVPLGLRRTTIAFQHV